MTDGAKGVLAMVLTCTVWGLSPLYYALLKHVPPLEVLSYRSLWSLGFFAVILTAQGRLHLVGHAIAQRQVWLIGLAAVFISANWFGFIFAIQAGQGMAASLGYYIFPLVAVVMGRVLFGETLGRAQWVAVLLAGLAVLGLTVGLGVPPWIALALAGTFGAYGVIKKQLSLGPVVSVTAEVALMAPLAIFWLLWAGTQGDATWQTHALLALSGPLTAMPLVLFSYAARRTRMSTVGLLQYINPTLQFACAVFAFGEPFTQWHAIAFPLIWIALVIYSIAAIRQERASRRAASSVVTSVAVVT
ncbi:EamA family transporter RarD [Yoonia sp.]|jgi:chloramphenicol-sensitive protein RarD|uniref:EamA family transporter RarD n=1 Tax=Yoonia sp. TaxID=2212373 RepID=UPI0025E19F66|nr:EamA family transporter RarD [Yoonia sp.]